MSREANADALEQLLTMVHASAKYRAVSADLIRAIGQRELLARRNLKEAVKATKNRLHQVAGAYMDDRMYYADWLAALTNAKAEGEAAFRATCQHIMRAHASTRERLPILSEIFATTLESLPPIHSVLDVACGLNPLALSWMPLAPGAAYYACDLYADLADFLNRFFEIAGVAGQAEVRDVITSPPTQSVDLALVLKVLPPLEQVDRGAGRNLLHSLNTTNVLVSFPTRSLGGRDRHMAENYEARFLAMMAEEAWRVQRFVFSSELCFLLSKPA